MTKPASLQPLEELFGLDFVLDETHDPRHFWPLRPSGSRRLSLLDARWRRGWPLRPGLRHHQHRLAQRAGVGKPGSAATGGERLYRLGHSP